MAFIRKCIRFRLEDKEFYNEKLRILIHSFIYSQTISLEEISGFVGISKNHLLSVFKERTSMSPMEYYNHILI